MALDKRKIDAPGRLEAFVNNYAKSVLEGKPNITAAYVAAGYSPKGASANAWRALNREDVKQYLQQVVMERCRQLDIDGTKIIKELSGIAFSPIMPGYISAADKITSLKQIGTFYKLWEGSRGDKVIVINVLPQDQRTL